MKRAAIACPSTPLLLAPFLAFALAGCGPPPYHGPASFQPVVGGHVGQIISFTGWVSPNATIGAPAPSPAKVLGARCVDEGVCEATVIDEIAVIGGRKVGATDVIIDYEHPTDHTRHTERVPVKITESSLFPLAVGPHRSAPPGAPHVITVLPDVKTPDGRLATYFCGASGAQESDRFELGDLMRGEGHVIACVAPVRLPSGQDYLGDLNLPEMAHHRSTQDIVYVCEHVKTRGADVLSLQIYRATPAQDARDALTLIEKRGEVTDVCGLKR